MFRKKTAKIGGLTLSTRQELKKQLSCQQKLMGVNLKQICRPREGGDPFIRLNETFLSIEAYQKWIPSWSLPRRRPGPDDIL